MSRVPAICAIGLIALGAIGLFKQQSREHQKTYEQLDHNYRHLEYGQAREKYIPQVEPAPVPEPVPDTSVQPVEQTDPLLTIEWYSWKDAPKVARETNKPAYIHFTKSENCAACENLRRNVFNDKSVIEASRNFVCVEIYLANTPEQDTAETKAALKAFGVNRQDGLPQEIFLYPGWSGKEPLKVHAAKIPNEPVRFTQFLQAFQQHLTK
jgi:hypothetical protein